MKNTVKTITLTIDELNNIVNNSASGNVEAAKNFIATKIEEKAERLARQREQRRQRKQQKKKAASAFSENPEYSEPSEPSESSENSPKTIYLPLNKDLAKCILWVNNRRDALKSNMTRIIREIALSGGAPSTLTSIEEAMNRLLQICAEAAEAAHNHLHAKHHLRPATAQCTLHKQTQAK